MKLRYFVPAALLLAAVTATLESESHGNWSNEKTLEIKEELREEVSNSSRPDVIPVTEEQEEIVKEEKHLTNDQQQFQLAQPFALPVRNKSSPEEILTESTVNISRPTRTSQSVANETVIVEYIPSQEILIQNFTATTKYYPQESGSNDLSQTISEDNLDVESIGEFGQRVRSPASIRQRVNEHLGRFRPKQSQDATEDQRKFRKNVRFYLSKKLNISDTKERLPFVLTKTEPQKGLKSKETEENYTESSFVTRDVPSSTSASIVSVSLGKFSGPIVVPDLPRQKKYSYTTTPYYTDNEVSKPTEPPIEILKSKIVENSYPIASSVVLNPLQVGVALMNAGQDLNSVSDQVPLIKEYIQNETETPNASDINDESQIQSDSPDSGNSTLGTDQAVQQEQISEVVASNLPSQSVEIQKSVEIYHAAPVHEIHYPMEFVPHSQPLVKQRTQEEYKKPSRGQFKEQRPNQVSIYKSNEILDESVPYNQDQGKYEYNVNDNDVIYASGQVDQTVPEAQVFGAKEQTGATQYDQTVVKYPRVVPDKQSDYVSSKTQLPRGVEGLPGLVNLESVQGEPQVQSPTEIRVLYPAEKSHHLADVVEKKVPFPVEKVIEKQITVPQPFPVHVPVDRVVEKQIRIPYPVHVEKVIEKKIPLAIQRIIIPVPIHFRVPQPVPLPVEKVIEKPVPIPIPVEKVVEKTVHVPRPYPLEIEKPRYPVESTKLVKTGPIYNDGNYQMIRQNYQPYAVDNEQNYHNSTGQFYGGYLAISRPYIRQPPLIHVLPKKFGTYSVQYPNTLTYAVNNGNLVAYGRTADKDKVLKDEYVGPVPRKVQQSSIGIQKSLYPDVQSNLRRTRQEAVNTGSFRQSKMEYGFKPPMVPSVQYDEETAAKVE